MKIGIVETLVNKLRPNREIKFDDHAEGSGASYMVLPLIISGALAANALNDNPEAIGPLAKIAAGATIIVAIGYYILHTDTVFYGIHNLMDIAEEERKLNEKNELEQYFKEKEDLRDINSGKTF
jgi:hypothetical protein